jgi:hypothetical protein
MVPASLPMVPTCIDPSLIRGLQARFEDIAGFVSFLRKPPEVRAATASASAPKAGLSMVMFGAAFHARQLQPAGVDHADEPHHPFSR